MAEQDLKESIYVDDGVHHQDRLAEEDTYHIQIHSFDCEQRILSQFDPDYHIVEEED